MTSSSPYAWVLGPLSNEAFQHELSLYSLGGERVETIQDLLERGRVHIQGKPLQPKGCPQGPAPMPPWDPAAA